MLEINFAEPTGGRQFTNAEKDFLSDLAKDKKTLCEIGSWVGDSTESLATVARNNNGVIYCVDWFQGNTGTDLIDKAKAHDIFSIFRRNMKYLDLMDYIKVLYMCSEDAVKVVKDDFFDFIFIDANHTYNHVKHDLTKWFPKLKSGGIICGHDYESPDYDEDHIHVDYVHDKHHGLIKAVNEFFGSSNITKGAGSIWWIQK
tara:strand:+ start:57 stop:659 length:603 start_codon:yes stop_codon:yes gene_type:complete